VTCDRFGHTAHHHITRLALSCTRPSNLSRLQITAHRLAIHPASVMTSRNHRPSSHNRKICHSNTDISR
jgi:hypothetical protein